VIALRPDDPDAVATLGRVLDWAGQRAAAELAYRRAIALGVGHEYAHVELAVMLDCAGKTVEAAAVFRDLVARFPNSADAWDCYARFLARDRRDERAAIAAYRKAAEATGQHIIVAGALDRLGYLSLRFDGPERAAALLDEIGAERPELLGKVRGSQAELWRLVGDADRSGAAYRAALRSPGSTHAGQLHFDMGVMLQQAGRLDEAAAAYTSAREAGYLGYTNHVVGPDERTSNVDELLAEVGRLRAFAARWPEVKADPSAVPDADVMPLADLAASPAHRRYALATRLYERAVLSGRPVPFEWPPLAHRTARAAVLAATRPGADNTGLGEEDVLGLLRSARGTLAAHTRKVIESKRSFELLRVDVDPAFAPVRDPKVLALLPAADRKAWEDLWAEVARPVTSP
jgi:tetratricopeptide (TPR) repeat protein